MSIFSASSFKAAGTDLIKNEKITFKTSPSQVTSNTITLPPINADDSFALSTQLASTFADAKTYADIGDANTLNQANEYSELYADSKFVGLPTLSGNNNWSGQNSFNTLNANTLLVGNTVIQDAALSQKIGTTTVGTLQTSTLNANCPVAYSTYATKMDFVRSSTATEPTIFVLDGGSMEITVQVREVKYGPTTHFVLKPGYYSQDVKFVMNLAVLGIAGSAQYPIIEGYTELEEGRTFTPTITRNDTSEASYMLVSFEAGLGQLNINFKVNSGLSRVTANFKFLVVNHG